MRIIKTSVLRNYWNKHPETRPALERWIALATKAEWSSMSDVQAAFPKAKILNSERARFEVAGGNYRLIVAFHFGRRIAWVKFIGTHVEYDAIDALTVSQF